MSAPVRADGTDRHAQQGCVPRPWPGGDSRASWASRASPRPSRRLYPRYPSLSPCLRCTCVAFCPLLGQKNRVDTRAVAKALWLTGAMMTRLVASGDQQQQDVCRAARAVRARGKGETAHAGMSTDRSRATSDASPASLTACRGSVRVKVVPAPSTLSTVTCPTSPRWSWARLLLWFDMIRGELAPHNMAPHV
jgi:hypothetical protein